MVETRPKREGTPGRRTRRNEWVETHVYTPRPYNKAPTYQLEDLTEVGDTLPKDKGIPAHHRVPKERDREVVPARRGYLDGTSPQTPGPIGSGGAPGSKYGEVTSSSSSVCASLGPFLPFLPHQSLDGRLDKTDHPTVTPVLPPPPC